MQLNAKAAALLDPVKQEMISLIHKAAPVSCVVDANFGTRVNVDQQGHVSSSDGWFDEIEMVGQLGLPVLAKLAMAAAMKLSEGTDIEGTGGPEEMVRETGEKERSGLEILRKAEADRLLLGGLALTTGYYFVAGAAWEGCDSTEWTSKVTVAHGNVLLSGEACVSFVGTMVQKASMRLTSGAVVGEYLAKDLLA